MRVKIIDKTENPLTTMGEVASKCWGTPAGREIPIAKNCTEENSCGRYPKRVM